MTQSDFGTINPTTKSGTQLAEDLNDFRDALNTKHSGAARPSYVQAGMEWLDTSAAPIWTVKLYDGSEDIVLYQIDTTNNIAQSPNTRQEVIKTADYTLTTDDAYIAIIMNKASAGVVALPALSGTNSELYFVKNIAVNAVTIDPNLTETIEGAANIILATNESAWLWVSSGKTTWRAAIFKNNAATITGTETLTNKTLGAGLAGEFLRGKTNGLLLSPNVTDPNNDTDHSAGSAASDGATPVLMTLASSITKRLDAAWAVGNNNGGLDTGSKANNTWYYRYLIQRSDTGVTDLLLSASATAPTMPANYDRKRRLPGGVRTDGSGNIIPIKEYPGRRFIYATPSSDINTTIGTSPSTHSVQVPPIQVIAILNLRIGIAAAFAIAYFSGPDQVAAAPVANTNESLRTDNISGGSNSVGRFEIDTATSLIRAQSTVASTSFTGQTIGFIDHSA